MAVVPHRAEGAGVMARSGVRHRVRPGGWLGTATLLGTRVTSTGAYVMETGDVGPTPRPSASGLDGLRPERPAGQGRHQPDRQLTPDRHGLATSGLCWLAMISTCLAKIRRLVPVFGGCGLGGKFCEQGMLLRQVPRLPAACCLLRAAVPRVRTAAARAVAQAAGPTGPPPPPSRRGVAWPR